MALAQQSTMYHSTDAIPNREMNAMARLFVPHQAAAMTLIVGLIALAPAIAAGPEETPFLAENDAAMQKMMSDMTIKPSGDVDRDFVAMMVPHHQGAVDMAQAELRYGKNEQLRRIAQEIIVDQLQEISAMHLALGEPLPAPAPAPTAMSQHGMDMSHASMGKGH
jgi:hypothetical protein